jgi:hypothetical protein
VTDITLQQGATFSRTYRWGTKPYVYKSISAVTKAAPVSLTVTGHGLKDGWRVAVSNVAGMTELNAQNEPPLDSEYHTVTVVDANTIELNEIVSLGYTAATANTGVIRYLTPVDLTGYTARLQIRRTAAASETLVSLTSEDGDITLDVAENTITVEISPTTSAALSFSEAVFQLELVASDGTVTRLDSGRVKFSREVTR